MDEGKKIVDTPVNGDLEHAPSSNWAYDHAVATTGIHGVGAGTIVGTTLAQTLSGKTLTTPIIASLYQASGGGLLTIPASVGADTFCLLGATQELDNKTLDSPVLKGTLTASGTVTLPAVTLGATVTLNGQTFDAGAGQAIITTTTSTVGLRIQSSGDPHGPEMTLAHAHNTPEATAFVGGFIFEGYDGATPAVAQNLGVLTVRYVNVGDGTEAVRLVCDLWTAGATNEAMTLSGAGALWLDAEVDTLIYKVSGTQVVGARVIDARCDDAINSGDATTDGVIDALRDAMIAHGLIAAA